MYCSDGSGPGVLVGGQLVEVDLALTQQAARTLAVQKDMKGNPKDNRNLYLVSRLRFATWSIFSCSTFGRFLAGCRLVLLLNLCCPERQISWLDVQAKEGHIQEGSTAWEEMSANDRNRRTRAAAEKNMKLRSPNFFVSTTRLSLRNIPPSLDEKALKKLVVDAVRPTSASADVSLHRMMAFVVRITMHIVVLHYR